MLLLSRGLYSYPIDCSRACRLLYRCGACDVVLLVHFPYCVYRFKIMLKTVAKKQTSMYKQTRCLGKVTTTVVCTTEDLRSPSEVSVLHPADGGMTSWLHKHARRRWTLVAQACNGSDYMSESTGKHTVGRHHRHLPSAVCECSIYLTYRQTAWRACIQQACPLTGRGGMHHRLIAAGRICKAQEHEPIATSAPMEPRAWRSIAPSSSLSPIR